MKKETKTSAQLRKLNFNKQQQKLLQKKTTFLAQAILSNEKDLDVTFKALFEGRGTKHVTALRWILWTVLKNGGATYDQIGAVVKKHHTTVLYQVGKDCPEGYEKLFNKVSKLGKKWDKENL